MNDSDTQAILGASGPGELVEALGQTWHVTPGRQYVKASYAVRLKLQARKELIDSREDLGESVYREEMDALKAQIDSGKYHWGGTVWRESVGETFGFLQLLWLMMQKHHPELTPADAEEIYWDAPELCKIAVRACLEIIDPKRFPPTAKKAAGGPKAADDAAASVHCKSPPSSSTAAGASPTSPTLTTAS